MTTPEARASIVIAAPIELVWQVMLDLAAYQEWNPFIVGVQRPDGELAVGSEIRLQVRWARGGGASSTERITELLAPTIGTPRTNRTAVLAYRFAGTLDRLACVRTTRVQRLEAWSEYETRYETHARFAGVLARLVPLRAVQDGFERHAAALRRRCESLVTRDSRGEGTSPRRLDGVSGP